MSEENQNELIARGHDQAFSELGGLLSNYQHSDDTNRGMSVDAINENLYRQNRDIVKKLFDSAAAIRDKPDQTFTIPELPGIAIPKKLFLQDLKTPSRQFMANYDRKNYHNLESLKKSKSAAAYTPSSRNKPSAPSSSPNLQSAKEAMFGKGFGGIGDALKGVAGLQSAGRGNSKKSKTRGRTLQSDIGNSVGPQKILPPLGRRMELGRAMSLNAAQSEARREQGGTGPKEGLGLSSGGLESELDENRSSSPDASMQTEQMYDPLTQRGSTFGQTQDRSPGSMVIEPTEELETRGGGRPESELERLKNFQSAQRQSSLASEQLTGEPGMAAKASKAVSGPEGSSVQRVAQPAKYASGVVAAAADTKAGTGSDLASALFMRAKQMQAQNQQNQINQLEQAKNAFESLKRGKQSFKNLIDAAQMAASGSWVTLVTLLAEWNLDIINKHVADSRIPYLEKKPSPGSTGLEKTISNVKDGVVIFADIVLSISCLAASMIPLVIITLIIYAQAHWSITLSIVFNKIFGH
ncbi:MAG: hypothetical protein PHS79_03160 [Patescibacteria group bacterium]|nr:hypothetical protein [Patescibacteria group bacterium]